MAKKQSPLKPGDNSEIKSKDVSLSRRELFGKYGAYTAPVVISMLVPQRAYANNTANIYSNVDDCLADHTDMVMTNMMGATTVTNACTNTTSRNYHGF